MSDQTPHTAAELRDEMRIELAALRAKIAMLLSDAAVEKVARGIALSVCYEDGTPKGAKWSDYRDEARAAIAVMIQMMEAS